MCQQKRLRSTVTGADPGICEGRGGPSRSPSFPSSPFPSPSSSYPLEVVPLKKAGGSGERCKLPPQWVLGRSPVRKRIWCTLKLSESHRWQSFWIFRGPCFTVERSKLALSNMTWVTVSVCRPNGGGRSRLGPPLNPLLSYMPNNVLHTKTTVSTIFTTVLYNNL